MEPHDDEPWPKDVTKLRSRIMYIEDKSSGLQGPARIGRVYFNRNGKTLYEVDSGDHFWISGPRRDQQDRLYGGNRGVEVDDDVREEYEAYIGGKP